MRSFRLALAATLLLAACGTPGNVTGIKTAAAGKVQAKRIIVDQNSDIDFIYDSIMRFADPNNSRNLVFYPKSSLHLTDDASKSVPWRDDNTVSPISVVNLVADGKLEMDDQDPTSGRGGIWLAVPHHDNSSDDFDKLKAQRDYYAKSTVGGDPFYNTDKVYKLDVRLVAIANQDAMGSDAGDPGCSELKGMAKYYANTATPPNDGQGFAYHHKQLLLVLTNIFSVGQKNADYDLLTYLRDFYSYKTNNSAFPDGAERTALIKQVNDAIDHLFGAERANRPQVPQS